MNKENNKDNKEKKNKHENIDSSNLDEYDILGCNDQLDFTSLSSHYQKELHKNSDFSNEDLDWEFEDIEMFRFPKYKKEFESILDYQDRAKNEKIEEINSLGRDSSYLKWLKEEEKLFKSRKANKISSIKKNYINKIDNFNRSVYNTGEELLIDEDVKIINGEIDIDAIFVDPLIPRKNYFSGTDNALTDAEAIAQRGFLKQQLRMIGKTTFSQSPSQKILSKKNSARDQIGV
jgi:hypothetical protein